MTKKLVIVESPAKAKTIAGYLGGDFVVESSIGHIRDLPNRASEVPKEKRAKYGTMGVAIDEGFEPLYIVDAGQEEGRRRSAAQAEGRERAPAGDGRGPRGRGDRVAPGRGAEAEGARAAHGLPRDHEGRDPAGAGRDARRRQAARRRAGDAAHPRPALRLRGLAGPLEEGDAGALRRPRAVGRGAARRRARARTQGLRLRVLLGSQGRLRAGVVRGAARRARRQARRAGPRLRPGRNAEDAGHGRRRRARGARPRRRARRRDLHRQVGRREAVHAPAGGAVHDVHAAAGGEPKAPLLRADDDAGRPAAVRERLHHLHAHRLDDAVGVGARGRAEAGGRALRRRTRSPSARASTRARSRTRRRRTRRSGLPATRSARPSRSSASWAATSSRSTS